MAKRKSTVNKAGNYTKPGLRKRLFQRIKASNVQGTAAGKWSARKAQLLAKRYKAAGVDKLFNKNTGKYVFDFPFELSEEFKSFEKEYLLL